MVIYIKSDENNRVLSWSSTRSSVDDITLKVEENHEVLSNPFIFKYECGELIKDEAYQQELIDEAEKEANKPTKTEKLEQALMELAIMTMNRRM